MMWVKGGAKCLTQSLINLAGRLSSPVALPGFTVSKLLKAVSSFIWDKLNASFLPSSYKRKTPHGQNHIFPSQLVFFSTNLKVIVKNWLKLSATFNLSKYI